MSHRLFRIAWIELAAREVDDHRHVRVAGMCGQPGRGRFARFLKRGKRRRRRGGLNFNQDRLLVRNRKNSAGPIRSLFIKLLDTNCSRRQLIIPGKRPACQGAFKAPADLGLARKITAVGNDADVDRAVAETNNLLQQVAQTSLQAGAGVLGLGAVRVGD